MADHDRRAVCLDRLRSGSARHEQPADVAVDEPAVAVPAERDPEQEALLTESVGQALEVVLTTLGPTERLVFVLHDGRRGLGSRLPAVCAGAAGAAIGTRPRAPVLDDREVRVASRLLYLVRHGEQDGADDGVDTGLSERGRRQARLLADRLRGTPFAAIHHGPARRAAETAELVAAALPGVPVHVSEIAGDYLPHDTDPAGLPPAYAEFLAGFTERERADGPPLAAEAVARFATAPPEGDVRELVITHNFLVAWLVRHALDAPERRWLGLNHHNCGLTVIRYSSGGPPALIAVNDVAHLPPDLRATGLPADYRV